MDPITAALVAALLAGAASGLTEAARLAITDGYAGLKALLQRKFGAPQVEQAVIALEAQPKSEGRKLTLHEELASAKADQDPELVQAAQDLLAKIQSSPSGAQIVQTVIGDHNIQITGSGNSVNTGKS